MKARVWLTTTILAALFTPAGARAEGFQGRFTVAFQAGTQSILGGGLLNGAEGSLLGKPITIESKSYRDVYAPDLRLQGLLGYGIGERTEIIARGTWYEADGTGLEVGTSDGNPVFAFFDPYEEIGFEVGLRFYISTAGRLKSYVAPVVGVRSLEEVLVDVHVPDAGSAVLNVPFNEKSTVPVFGLDIGFTFDLGTHFFVGVDTGLRYQTAPSQFDFLGDLSAIDDSSAQWTAPVVASLGVRF
jgi:hypothetical protein